MTTFKMGLWMSALVLMTFAPAIGSANNKHDNDKRKVIHEKAKPASVWVISSVGADTLTVTTTDKSESKTFKVNKTGTTIVVNGQPAHLNDLKRGMRVDFVMGGDASCVSRITATGTETHDDPGGKGHHKDGKHRK
jgi:hypothetical protein